MAWLRVLIARVAGFFTRARADRELNDEIQAHVEMLEEENRRKGMSPTEAHAAALREFGGIEQMKEVYRETNGLRFIETLAQDVRYSLRMLRRNPGFAITVVLLLALGIGANTAIFSAVDAVMLRLLPVKDPQQLVIVQWTSQSYPEEFVTDMEGAGRHRGSGGPFDFGGAVFSYASFTDIQKRNHVFTDTFAFAENIEQVNVGFGSRAESAIVQGVSGNYFAALGVPAIIGRTISSVDDQDAASPAAVVSYSFWRRKLGGDRSVANQSVNINGMPVTLVGVAPPEFFGLQPGVSSDFWIPLHLYSQHQEQLGNMDNGLPFLKDPKTWWVGIVGRLRSGISEAQARTEVDGVFQQSLQPPGGPTVAANKMPRIEIIAANRGLDTLRLEYSQSLLLLMAMAGVVLLVACSNVAGLLLARSTARQREIAVRLSLGARRLRLIRQLLTESVLLAGLGGAAGLVLAVWANSALARLFSTGQSPINLDLKLNTAVLAFTSIVSLGSGILFGLAPALRATREQPVAALKPGASSGASGRRFTSGKVLTGAQVAMSLLLLVPAGLLVRTLRELQTVNLGFEREHLLLFNVAPGLNGYREARLGNYYRELQRRIESVPGVRSASFATRAPIGEGIGSSSGAIPGYTPPGQEARLYRHAVGPGYFDTLRIPVILGRVIDARDEQNAPLAAVINQTAARTWFHNDNPVGHRIVFGKGAKQRDYEIVGVVQDVKYNQLRADMLPTIYFSYLQWHEISNWMTFAVRADGAVVPLIAAITREALALDRNVPLSNLKTQTEVIEEMLVLERSFAVLSTLCGALALLLACVGLYGTMAYAVSRRTNEIGVRMALGAQRETILGMVLRETLVLVVVGLALGFPLAWIATTTLKSQLYGLTVHDPATMFLATLAILAVTAFAGYLPARRASRVDPMVALRYE